MSSAYSARSSVSSASLSKSTKKYAIVSIPIPKMFARRTKGVMSSCSEPLMLLAIALATLIYRRDMTMIFVYCVMASRLFISENRCFVCSNVSLFVSGSSWTRFSSRLRLLKNFMYGEVWCMGFYACLKCFLCSSRRCL